MWRGGHEKNNEFLKKYYKQSLFKKVNGRTK